MRITSTQNMTTGQVVQRAVTFSAIGFVVWVALTALIWFILRLAGVDFEFWPMLEALSTAAAVAQFFGGGVVALWQLRDSADSRNLGIYNDIFEKLMSSENIEARRWIYINLPDDPQTGIDDIDEDGQRHVKNVLNSLDHLGFLLEQDWITGEGEDAIIKWVSPFVVKCWARLEPYIDFEAARRHEPDYYDSIRKLAERCIAWRKTNLPEARITWVGKSL
jgi:hypothetical protein